MSNLSDFFPQGPASGVGIEATLIMVGGGGGSGKCCGAGSGGYFYGTIPVTPGVSYPVVIGSGGAPGTPTSCATAAGLGNPGSPSKFGRYEALGGGGGATICGSLNSTSGTWIPGSPGGVAGGVSETLNICYGPVGQCICPICDYIYTVGSSQRVRNPHGYCGALGDRTKVGCGTQWTSGFNECIPGARSRRSVACCGCTPCTSVCPEFFGVCLASIPYTICPAPTIPGVISPAIIQNIRAGGCNRTVCCVCAPYNTATNILNCQNTGWGSYGPACNGDSGVVLIAYPCVVPAATSFPGGVDCSPVSIPQNGFRTYKFTSSGSFTL